MNPTTGRAVGPEARVRWLRAIAHHVIVMRGGEIVEQGEVGSLFDAPAHAYTRELLSAAG